MFQIDLLPNGEEHKADGDPYRNLEESVKRHYPAACRSRHKHNDHEGDACISKRASRDANCNAYQSDDDNGRSK
jgi:hypothetical protein